MISNIDIMINEYEATLSKQIKLYRGDTLTLSFALSNTLISRIESENIIDGILPLDGSITAKVLIEDADKIDYVSGTVINNNRIEFKLLEKHTNKVGINKMQIVLLQVSEDNFTEILHSPPFEFEIRNPIGNLDEEYRTDRDIVDKARTDSSTGETAYIINLGYTPWTSNEIIATSKLNFMYNLICKNILDIEELKYKPISITSLSLSKSIVEKGTVVTNLVANWSYNKTPISQSFNGIILDNNIKTYSINGTYSSDTSFTLKASDGKTNISKNIDIKFYNGKYFGSKTEPVTYDSSFIKSLSKTLTNSKNGNFTVNCGAGQYIYFAIPSNFGTPKFYVGGFEGGFDLVATINYTNDHNYTEQYRIYKSGTSNLGNTTVTVN